MVRTDPKQQEKEEGENDIVKNEKLYSGRKQTDGEEQESEEDIDVGLARIIQLQSDTDDYDDEGRKWVRFEIHNCTSWANCARQILEIHNVVHGSQALEEATVYNCWLGSIVSFYNEGHQIDLTFQEFLKVRSPITIIKLRPVKVADEFNSSVHR